MSVIKELQKIEKQNSKLVSENAALKAQNKELVKKLASISKIVSADLKAIAAVGKPVAKKKRVGWSEERRAKYAASMAAKKAKTS